MKSLPTLIGLLTFFAGSAFAEGTDVKSYPLSMLDPVLGVCECPSTTLGPSELSGIMELHFTTYMSDYMYARFATQELCWSKASLCTTFCEEQMNLNPTQKRMQKWVCIEDGDEERARDLLDEMQPSPIVYGPPETVQRSRLPFDALTPNGIWVRALPAIPNLSHENQKAAQRGLTIAALGTIALRAATWVWTFTRAVAFPIFIPNELLQPKGGQMNCQNTSQTFADCTLGDEFSMQIKREADEIWFRLNDES